MPLLLLSALIPALVLLLLFYFSDRYPEPGRVVLATFGLGVLTVIPVVIFVLLVQAPLAAVSQDPYVVGAIDAFVLASLPEEVFKFLVLALYVRKHSAFDEPMDGLVYGATASLGFAALENVLYVTGGGLGLAITRALTAVPMHAALGALLGYGVARSRFDGRPLLLALPLPILLHGLYDWPLLTLRAAGSGEGGALADGEVGMLIVGALVILIVTLASTARLARRMRREQRVQAA